MIYNTTEGKPMRMKIAMLTLAMLAPALSFAHPSEDENKWVEAIRPFYSDAQAMGIKPQITIMTDQTDGATPAYTRFNAETKTCTFIVAIRNNRAADIVLAKQTTEHEKEVARMAIFAHEYGHCLKFLADVEHGKKAGHEDKIFSAIPGEVRSVTTNAEEGGADVYALAWFAQNRPKDFEIAFNFFQYLRTDVAFVGDAAVKGSRYDVVSFLSKAKNFRELYDEKDHDPFELAMSVVETKSLPMEPNKTVIAAITSSVNSSMIASKIGPAANEQLSPIAQNTNSLNHSNTLQTSTLNTLKVR